MEPRPYTHDVLRRTICCQIVRYVRLNYLETSVRNVPS